MDNFATHHSTNFQQMRSIVEEQIRLQTFNRSKPPKYEVEREKPTELQPPLLDGTEKLLGRKPDNFKGDSDDDLRFKITGQTFYKIMDILMSRSIQDRCMLNTQPNYDYLPVDVLQISLKVKHCPMTCPSTRSSISDCYINVEQHSIIKEKSDLKKHTIIKDYNLEESKTVPTFRTGRKVYYDKYQNPRVERRYMSVIDESDEINQPKYHSTISEIIQSEYAYVTGLYDVYYNYIVYFREDPSKKLFKLYPFFTLIEQIYYQQLEFYKKLMTCNNVEDLAYHFVENEKNFGLYRNYILNLNTVHKYITIDYRFEILNRQRELVDQTALEDHLLSPLQRLNTYVLQLEKLESQLRQKCRISSKVTIILGIFKKILSSKSDAEIIDCIINRPSSLLNFGSFIMKEFFYVKKLDPCDKMVLFLFQEVIIFTVPVKNNLYDFKHCISMEDLYIRIVVDNPISFEITDFRTSKDKEKNLFVLENFDPRVKEVWVEVIESLLWEQLIICKSKVGDKTFKEKLV